MSTPSPIDKATLESMEDLTSAVTSGSQNEAEAAALIVDNVVTEGQREPTVTKTTAVLSPTLCITNDVANTLSVTAPSTLAKTETPAAPTTSIVTSTQLQVQPQQQHTQPEQPPKSLTSSGAPETATAPTAVSENMLQNKRKERLEQNRISARESRKRKKSMIEELQRTVIALTAENKELNGRNQSLRSNLADIGRKYPNSVSIQTILNGVPTPSPQNQQRHQPAPQPQHIPNAATLQHSNLSTSYLQYSQQQHPLAPNVSSVSVVPMVAPHPTATPQMVPYMYIPQSAPVGLVPMAAPPQQQSVVTAPTPAPTVPTMAVPVAAAPMGIASVAPTTAPGLVSQEQQLQPQQHIAIAPQPSPMPIVPAIVGTAQQTHQSSLPVGPATVLATTVVASAPPVPSQAPTTQITSVPDPIAVAASSEVNSEPSSHLPPGSVAL